MLDEGRLVITDNWYTSLELATYLYKRKTNLLGTIRKNRRGLPTDLAKQNLKKVQLVAKQNDYITMMKWKDQRDVYILSTCHDETMESVGRDRAGNAAKLKPSAILKYNAGKQGVDISDQLSSYYTSLRKSITWYKKIAIEVICGTLVVNTQLVFNKLQNVDNHSTLLKLRESLIRSLLPETIAKEPSKQQDVPTKNKRTTPTHKLEELPRGPDNKLFRKRCHGCYIKLKTTSSSKEAALKAKKVNTICSMCNQAFCISCYAKNH